MTKILEIAVAALMACSVMAGPSVKTTSDVINVNSGNVVGSSTVIRTPNGVSVVLKTRNSGIPAGHAVTMWLCILRKDGINFDCVHLSGHIVGAGGNLNLAGWVGEGDTSESIAPVGGADGLGLEDALHDDLLIVVRDHGPAAPGSIPDQIHTFQPDCTTCADPDPLESLHLAP